MNVMCKDCKEWKEGINIITMYNREIGCEIDYGICSDCWKETYLKTNSYFDDAEIDVRFEKDWKKWKE